MAKPPLPSAFRLNHGRMSFGIDPGVAGNIETTKSLPATNTRKKKLKRCILNASTTRDSGSRLDRPVTTWMSCSGDLLLIAQFGITTIGRPRLVLRGVHSISKAPA